MGKDWDKALPSIDIWKECVRVLKPGAFAFVMSAPRSDVHSRMCLMLEDAGFRIDFTPIAWSYATGFPKAMNISKAVDKRKGLLKSQTGFKVAGDDGRKSELTQNKEFGSDYGYVHQHKSNEAKQLDGSYAGFQPKPAWENVIVCMKPLDQKGYLDQAMKNQKGITWLDGCRIPFQSEDDYPGWWESGAKGSDGYLGTDTFKIRDMSAEEIKSRQFKKPKKKMTDKERYTQTTSRYGDGETGFGTTEHIYGDNTTKYSKKKQSDYDKYVDKMKSFKGAKTIGEVKKGGTSFLGGDIKEMDPSETYQKEPMGRFPANLLVQDDILNDGKTTKSTGGLGEVNCGFESGGWNNKKPFNYQDEDSFSRFYDLDAWWEERIKELPLNVQATYPFIIVPKASKSEKNKGLEDTDGKYLDGSRKVGSPGGTNPRNRGAESKRKNFHPTVKPISLMSYLITLGSREGDLVLDPFVGSGTTCIAAKLLNRKYIGMEMDDEYVVIAQERIKAHKPEETKHDFF